MLEIKVGVRGDKYILRNNQHKLLNNLEKNEKIKINYLLVTQINNSRIKFIKKNKIIKIEDLLLNSIIFNE
jgi:hypothetical protein